MVSAKKDAAPRANAGRAVAQSGEHHLPCLGDCGQLRVAAADLRATERRAPLAAPVHLHDRGLHIDGQRARQVIRVDPRFNKIISRTLLASSMTTIVVRLGDTYSDTRSRQPAAVCELSIAVISKGAASPPRCTGNRSPDHLPAPPRSRPYPSAHGILRHIAVLESSVRRAGCGTQEPR